MSGNLPPLANTRLNLRRFLQTYKLLDNNQSIKYDTTGVDRQSINGQDQQAACCWHQAQQSII